MRAGLIIIIAYLIGSIPFGYLIVRMSGGGDIREMGSGGTGATNVLRLAGKVAGFFTLMLDVLKGMIAVLVAGMLARAYQPNWEVADWVLLAAALAAIAGHIFPVWLGFRGGKGVATAAGVFLMLHPVALLCAGVAFVIVVALTRYVSLGSITAAVTVPFSIALMHLFVQRHISLLPLLMMAVVSAALILLAHRQNIRRLLRGTEPKLS